MSQKIKDARLSVRRAALRNLPQARYSAACAIAAREGGMLYLPATPASPTRPASDWAYAHRTVYNSGRMADMTSLR